MTTNEKIMYRCLELAGKGAGYVSPNPLVGCVIAKNGKIIAEGYHKKFGSNHAEINAINSAIKKGVNLKGAELYVNLEPCSHYGKTPPCVDKIIQHKISKVIIGIKDPNSLISGKGIKKLKQNGVRVKTGVLVNECRELNRFFLKFVKTGVPYVTIKTAQTLDGKIADKNYNSKWISSIQSRKLVHRLRRVFDAVLIGKKTLEIDNPSLTVRHVKGRNPYRIVIDRRLTLSLNKKIFSDIFRHKTIVITSAKAGKKKINDFEKRNIKVIMCKTKNSLIDLKDALKKLASLGITSILVEGGAITSSEFLKNKLADAMMLFIAPKIMGDGINAFNITVNLSRFRKINFHHFKKDILISVKK
ncbi:MAG: bifunctional diaminohydroxyphosphoribosylaminopyrimidine deaminase/5-amino-6-(5-phosphoribosylamino)uracil reductase RibD [Chlorobi bacterium]|nr:bifunctional diaminohydroxyphosphoribosylaminopyrimidine deaminase/5-amino-6-(5-phosphoribosylamino)uracil reductase RibD [Chlorobiota bacterium]MCI0716885.1 bifunctional diaminohydroxyphosphoribosylaminopyrimidine deaminase/5-amino-6-(5-phosphoribosylamino)uracil reductase RibD [Chlorobiota bacterium]